jgi:hypothetical protein
MGRRFVLMIDHCGLRYLFDQPNLNARQARWMDDPDYFRHEMRAEI